MSEIPETVRAEMLAHAKACFPNEACGCLVGDSANGRIQRFVPITNAAGSPTRFVFEPHEQLAAEQAIDTAEAGSFDPFGILLLVVVAPTTGEIRSHRIIKGEVAAR